MTQTSRPPERDELSPLEQLRSWQPGRLFPLITIVELTQLSENSAGDGFPKLTDEQLKNLRPDERDEYRLLRGVREILRRIREREES